MLKICSRCDNIKMLEDFSKDKTQSDGRCKRCKDCDKEDYRSKNPLPIELRPFKEISPEWFHKWEQIEQQPKTSKRCNTCKQDKPFSEFGRSSNSKDKMQWDCKACNSIKSTQYNKNK